MATTDKPLRLIQGVEVGRLLDIMCDGNSSTKEKIHNVNAEFEDNYTVLSLTPDQDFVFGKFYYMPFGHYTWVRQTPTKADKHGAIPQYDTRIIITELKFNQLSEIKYEVQTTPVPGAGY